MLSGHARTGSANGQTSNALAPMSCSAIFERQMRTRPARAQTWSAGLRTLQRRSSECAAPGGSVLPDSRLSDAPMNARSTPVERAHGGLTRPFQHAPDLYGGPSAPPRAVRTDRALRAAAMPRRRNSRMIGSTFAAKAFASPLLTAAPALLASARLVRLPSFAPLAFNSRRAFRVRSATMARSFSARAA